MKHYLFIFSGIVSLVLGLGFWPTDHDEVLLNESSTAKLLLSLGDTVMKNKVPDYHIVGVSAEKGYEIITQGFTTKPKGGKSGKQSSHFVCTSCHNIEREDPDLLKPNPEDRLTYTSEKGIPFLQGTTLFGAVNRETYYNGDYEKKYGDLVKPARNDIREAIQLCAVECAQGRELKPWEVESVLAYLWEIDYKIVDLALDKNDLKLINEAKVNGNTTDAIEMITSLYTPLAKATFTYPPEDRQEGYAYEGNADNGRLIYENSCLHCHYRQKYSYLHLDKGKLSKKHLKSKIAGYSRHSIYQVIRWGVSSKSGKRSYMPQYTQEKLSDQMVEDLRAYLES